jgi:S-adenosylmethionine decarboxylase
MKKIRIVLWMLFAFFIAPLAAQAEEQPAQNSVPEACQFQGRHLIAQYYECDQAAISNIKELTKVMRKAVKASGASHIRSSKFVSPAEALNMAFFFSKSHASIHTSLEHKVCFVDFFTCEASCAAEKFDQMLRDYLKPQRIESKIIERK